MSAAAFGVRYFANEMVFANDSVARTEARLYLNATALLCRTWHERVLYASSTLAVDLSEVHYSLGDEQPAYKASALVETVSLWHVSKNWLLVDIRTDL